MEAIQKKQLCNSVAPGHIMSHLHQLLNTYFKPLYVDSHIYSFQTDQGPVA